MDTKENLRKDTNNTDHQMSDNMKTQKENNLRRKSSTHIHYEGLSTEVNNMQRRRPQTVEDHILNQNKIILYNDKEPNNQIDNMRKRLQMIEALITKTQISEKINGKS